MVRLVLTFACRQPRFTAEVVTTGEFLEEARQAGIRAVPTLLLPGDLRLIGNIPPPVLAERLLEAAAGPAGRP
ncbi:protein of unknown function [Candidatus Hydrogenisulfobacillus filiaventi]|uniref:Thioredoxin-like fold domain-containing protein n=1 Tax=Candidatus Hydrogenisulfobacillus filiaventi TaxID=2707344 RepID=A0A6F8ZGU4_9FIRM|nr:hypothetical protein [Bacillota bacterium]CAB1128812.1 protein of unknown function [Candidatus Hydrogenisulfobacillus filiaventi]